ncbi:MBL fold metallo-hydrolase [Paenibacillus planticolens]|uniref:MBL fold metallo-hydrolase n=1 Tax=Paenibacillus planticolens TaxID=2654976 RepID=A0ABX1ZFI2_9BACL|nr:MBL fold metallo-hydrolase [Paenibacillus planticolens]NOU98853.1 MBL fold metallo-hydrolase [Paenibacillus planticolens]
MSIKQISEHIWSVRTWMIIPVHVWAVVDHDGVTLVDAGVPWMAKSILRLINELGPLKQIVLTHGHGDHVGTLKRILQVHSVPVFAHRKEIPFVEGRTPYPGRSKAVAQVAKGVLQPLPEDEDGRLSPIGGLTPYFTPGHSPGHVVYYHEKDDVLLTGDLFNSKKGKLFMARFTPDPEEALRSSAIVKQLNPKRLEVCHGDTVFQPAEQLDELMKR